jgi:hypothetical protein
LDCRIEKAEKCTRQYALIVAKNVKFRSSLTEADPYTVENAMLNGDPREDTKLTGRNLPSSPHFFFFFVYYKKRIASRLARFIVTVYAI